MADAATFSPDWLSPPGDTIADLLTEKGWTYDDLAARTDFSREFVDALLQGRAPLTVDAAQQISAVLGSSAEFRLAREAQYREGLSRQGAEGAKP